MICLLVYLIWMPGGRHLTAIQKVFPQRICWLICLSQEVRQEVIPLSELQVLLKDRIHQHPPPMLPVLQEHPPPMLPVLQGHPPPVPPVLQVNRTHQLHPANGLLDLPLVRVLQAKNPVSIFPFQKIKILSSFLKDGGCAIVAWLMILILR